MITFLKRLFIHSAIFFFVLLPLMIIGAILLLIVLPFLPEKYKYNLPKYLRWFDSVDPYSGRDTSVYYMICDYGWWARYKWLAWRNPVNYFDYKALGLFWNGTERFLKYDPKEDAIGDGTKSGLRHIEIDQQFRDIKLSYYEYYFIYRYPFLQSKCFRFRMGWKIKDTRNQRGSVSQWCLVLNPFHPW